MKKRLTGLNSFQRILSYQLINEILGIVGHALRED